jgi:predicted phosphohydrolase
MRIVAVADTHLYQADLGTLPAGDVFIHAGDLLRGGTLEELRSLVPWLVALPHPHKILVAGNHDWCFARSLAETLAVLGPGFIYLQDSGITVDEVRFWGSPWQPEYNHWAFNLPRGEALAERWRLIPEQTDVLITHGPPRGIGDRAGMARREGCEELLKAVGRVRPILHLFGHIHEDGGLWRVGETTFANVTTWESERGPSVFEFDPRNRTVAAVQVPG